ncbi:MAG: DUF4349 domain-containing protein [Clostridia bacterium]|nr:DUF4349 domain-containing protein [Clostridia bacterium]
MKKGLIATMLLVLATAMLFVGCSPAATNEAVSDDYYAEKATLDMVESEEMAAEAPMDDRAYDEEYAEEAFDGDDSAGGTNVDIDDSGSILEPSVDRKIIFSGYIAARTKAFDEDYRRIMSKVKEVGGYVESSNVSGTKPEEWNDRGRYAEITVRVPSAKFDSFIRMLEGVGETTSSSVSGQDVSLQYFDVETRLETLRIREDRLQELLEKAATLEDIIELERELANVSYEIQSYEMSLRSYDSLIDFSTITLNLEEVQEQAEIVPSEKTLGERISNAFYSVINWLARFFKGFAVVFIAALPVIAILAAILIIVLVSVKSAKRRKRRKQEQQEKENK